MLLDQGFCERQSKPCTFIFLCKGTLDLAEHGQGLCNLFRCDPNTTVRDLEGDVAI